MRLIFILLIIILNLGVSKVIYSQIITTVVGGGTHYTPCYGDGGQATNATFTFGEFAVDDNGDIYIADPYCNKIRKVDHITGIINSFAGTGVVGYNGDGILATDAQLNAPYSPIFDAYGNLYFLDLQNGRYRKIDKITGVISTFAGNGTASYLGSYSPDGTPATAAICDMDIACFDNSGNLIYGGFEYTYRLRKISTIGIISTIAGTGMPGAPTGDGGPATLAKVNPISAQYAIDYSSDIYFTDSQYAVRKIDGITGLITRIAGTGDNICYPYSGDGFLATNTHLSALGLTFDNEWNLYICDGGNNRIIKIDSAGYTHTIVGTGISGFSGDNGPATAAKLYTPEQIIFDKCDNLYIADFGNNRIRKVTYHTDCKVDIPKKMIHNDITLYPNPATTEINIDNIKAETNYRIFNTIGNIEQTGILKVGNNRVTIKTLTKGLHLIEITDSEGMKIIKKFIKE